MTSSKGNFRFRMNTDINFGLSISSNISKLIRQKGLKKPFIIVDHNVLSNKDIKNIIKDLHRSFNSGKFTCKIAEPNYDYLDSVKNILIDETLDCLVAIGGGSVMDLSKGLAVLLKNEGPSISFKGFPKNIEEPLPVITVPTLAGTGSEIAYNAVFTDSKNKMRLGINTEKNYPILSIIDPLLTLSAPRNAVISGSLDCLNHITEGFISVNSSKFTREISKSAFFLWRESITKLMEDFESIEAREELFMSSIFANMALNNVGSGLGGDFSYPLGALHGVPHGVGEGIFLPYLYTLYVERGFTGFAGLYDALSLPGDEIDDKEKSEAFCNIIKEIYNDIQAPSNLNDFGLNREMIPSLVDAVRPSFSSAPVDFDEVDATELLENFIL